MRALVLLPVLGVVLSACGEDPTEMPERAACMDRAGVDRYARLTLAPGIDGIGFATAGGPYALSSTLLPVLGTPCAKATARGACESRARELLDSRTNRGWQIFGRCPGPLCGATTTYDRAVISVGDDVHLATLDEVRDALLPIDSVDEAAALLVMYGFRSDCDVNNVRGEADGWTFKITDRFHCGASETFTKVSRAGIVSADGGTKVDEGWLCQLGSFTLEGGD